MSNSLHSNEENRIIGNKSRKESEKATRHEVCMSDECHIKSLYFARDRLKF